MHNIFTLWLPLLACGNSKASDWISVPLTNPSKVAMIDNDSVSVSGNVRRALLGKADLPIARLRVSSLHEPL